MQNLLYDYCRKGNHTMTEEEILRAIFEGPIRPLTKEDQIIQDGLDKKYQENVEARDREYAKILGISVERVQEMRKKNLLGLVEAVALKKIRDPDGRRARNLRALLGPR